MNYEKSLKDREQIARRELSTVQDAMCQLVRELFALDAARERLRAENEKLVDQEKFWRDELAKVSRVPGG
jgi:hypothetical protein